MVFISLVSSFCKFSKNFPMLNLLPVRESNSLTIPVTPERDRPTSQSQEQVDKAQGAMVEPCCMKPPTENQGVLFAQGVLVD